MDSRADRRAAGVSGGSRAGSPTGRVLAKSTAAVKTPWVGTFGSLRVPTMVEVSWHLPEGTFTYWRGRVIEFRVLRWEFQSGTSASVRIVIDQPSPGYALPGPILKFGPFTSGTLSAGPTPAFARWTAAAL